MARKRMVDPEFWLDEDTAILPDAYQLFYIGSWNFSDDFGVIEDSAVKMKAQIFPYREIDVSPIIKKLKELGKYLPFEVNGKKYLLIKNFLKYQRVDKPSKFRNPPPPASLIVEDSGSTQGGLPSEEKRREVKLREEKIEHSVEYLKKIPDADLIEFNSTYEASKSQIKTKAEDLYLYCGSKGKTYRNYRMFLLGALRKDFKKRAPVEVKAPVVDNRAPLPKELTEQMRALTSKFKA